MVNDCIVPSVITLEFWFGVVLSLGGSILLFFASGYKKWLLDQPRDFLDVETYKLYINILFYFSNFIYICSINFLPISTTLNICCLGYTISIYIIIKYYDQKYPQWEKYAVALSILSNIILIIISQFPICVTNSSILISYFSFNLDSTLIISLDLILFIILSITYLIHLTVSNKKSNNSNDKKDITDQSDNPALTYIFLALIASFSLLEIVFIKGTFDIVRNFTQTKNVYDDNEFWLCMLFIAIGVAFSIVGFKLFSYGTKLCEKSVLTFAGILSFYYFAILADILIYKTFASISVESIIYYALCVILTSLSFYFSFSSGRSSYSSIEGPTYIATKSDWNTNDHELLSLKAEASLQLDDEINVNPFSAVNVDHGLDIIIKHRDSDIDEKNLMKSISNALNSIDEDDLI